MLIEQSDKNLTSQLLQTNLIKSPYTMLAKCICFFIPTHEIPKKTFLFVKKVDRFKLVDVHVW